MDEHLPTATLCGMADPHTWLVQLAQCMTRRVPTTPPCWHHGPPGQGTLAWHTMTGAGEPVSLWLWATPTAVAIRVWRHAWQGVELIGDGAYRTFLTTIAMTLIDQDTDPDDPPVQLQIQAMQPHARH
jgi:hypothetical protein